MIVSFEQERNLRMLYSIYTSSGLAAQEPAHTRPSFKKLGFSAELPELAADFSDVGLFGLVGLYGAASLRSEDFSRVCVLCSHYRTLNQSSLSETDRLRSCQSV